jgi:tetratricopeptide (TPR) repeat protein
MTQSARETSADFLARLKEDLVSRRVEQGMATLDKAGRLLSALDPRQQNAGRVAGLLAQWVDVGYKRPELVSSLVARFSKADRGGLPLHDYLHLRLAEGMLAMTDESTDEAIRHLDFVLSLEDQTDDKELLSVANFWKGRCLRMKGEYDAALAYAVKGRKLAQELGREPMAAVMRVLESWLYFQKGNARQALQILQEAEHILSKTDDYLTLGNIHSSYGRIARRQGRYQHAVEHFAAAIARYRRRNPRHRNVARCLNNLASTKRLIALQLLRKIDADAARRRRAATRGHRNQDGSKPHNRTRYTQLRDEALAELDEAASIYQEYRNHHGLGSVHLNYGYLHLDNGDLDLAEAEGKIAFRLAEQKGDYILMARSRLLDCMVENARVEEEIGENAEPGAHARRAQDCAREAIELAGHTQNRRLLADAHIWQGLTFCNSFFDDPDSARASYDQAVSLSRGTHADSAWEDLERLRTRVLRGGKVNPVLRAWSQGSVGDKTFQQITEEFAEFIIPKVWEREGRKISRVATRLSMSPKKVRRILGRAGRRKSSPKHSR